MKCTHEKTIFENNTTGYCVIAFRTEDTNVPYDARSKYRTSDSMIRFTATGYHLPKTDVIDVELDGRWETNQKFGKQLVVEHCVEIIPKTTDGIIGYLSSGLIKGIGEKTAKNIVAKFGIRTLDVFDNEPEKLLEVKGITKPKLNTIIASYNQSKDIREAVAFLSPFGISVKKAAKIHQQFGADTMTVLQTRPFELCSISGFGFKTVDAIARNMKCSLNDPLRIHGAIIYILDESAVSGHLYLPNDELCQKAHEILNDGFAHEVVMLKKVQSELYMMALNAKVISDNGNIYKPFVYTTETETAKYIARFLKGKTAETDITKEIADAQRKLGITLAPNQIEAVKMCLSNRISIITGGPGTGKTTILKVILTVYEKISKGKILLTAPTGRASRRMAESTGFPEAATLHSTLGLIADDEENSYMNSDEPLEYDFVVVDEMSMTDMKLAYELFRRLDKNTKILFLGDADQLPSVGAGNVFRELITSGLISVTYLDMVFRQSSGSRIALNAHSIKNNQSTLMYGPDFEFVPCETSEDAARLISECYMKESSVSGISNVQILSPFKRNGGACVKNLNDIIRELVNPKSSYVPELKSGTRVFRKNDRVLQIKNKGDVSNGDVGSVISVYNSDDNDSFVKIEFSEGRIVDYGAEDLDIIEHAYAMTIHKSQGSEYETVIMPILNSFYIMLKRNLIYTAITRAKKKVVIIGQKQALHMAIHKDDDAKRNTLLAKRIRDCL